MSGFIDPTKDDFARFRKLERTGIIQMLNLVRVHQRAVYSDGCDVSGADAYRAYGEASAPVFQKVGGRIAWRGRFEMLLIGPDSERWDFCFIAEYPSVAAFVAMIRDPIYREAVKHRKAAVADSRLIRLEPVGVGSDFSA